MLLSRRNLRGLCFISVLFFAAAFSPNSATTTTDRRESINRHLPQASIFNINEKGSAFGFDRNAEVWNGRVAQIAFAWVFIQEWNQGKGALFGLKDGDTASMVSLGIFTFLVSVLSIKFALTPPKPDSPKKKKKKEGFQLNLNEAGGPFGFNPNAEIWNGRFAMVSIVWIFVQEFLRGEGLLKGLIKAPENSIMSLVAFLTLITGFTWLSATAEEETTATADGTAGPSTVEAISYETYLRDRQKLEIRDGAATLMASVSGVETEEPAVNPANLQPPRPLELDSRISQSSPPRPVLGKPRPVRRFSLDSGLSNPRTVPEWNYNTIVSEGNKYGSHSYGKAVAEPATIRGTLQDNAQPEPSPKLYAAQKDPSLRAYDDARWSFELAELWNGRFAQELIQGRGVLKGIQLEDPVNIAALLTTVLAAVGVGAYSVVNANEAIVSTGKTLVKPASSADRTTVAAQFKPSGYRFTESTASAIVSGQQSQSGDGLQGNNGNSGLPNALNSNRPKTEEPLSAKSFKPDGYRFNPDTVTALSPSTAAPYSTTPTKSQQPSDTQQPRQPDPGYTFPVPGFKFGSDTSTAIMQTKRNTSVPYPEELQGGFKEPIQSPSYSNIDVVAENMQPLNVAQTSEPAVASYGASYLESLSRISKESIDPPSEPVVVTAQKQGAVSYLETLGSSQVGQNRWSP